MASRHWFRGRQRMENMQQDHRIQSAGDGDQNGLAAAQKLPSKNGTFNYLSEVAHLAMLLARRRGKPTYPHSAGHKSVFETSAKWLWSCWTAQCDDVYRAGMASLMPAGCPMFQASLPFFTPEARKPGQRIRSTRNDRAENQPVSDDTVEDKERKSPKVPSAQFGHNRGPQVQKVSSAAGGCLDRFDRLIDS